ncbi:unnamed protein product [Linum trigynum]
MRRIPWVRMDREAITRPMDRGKEPRDFGPRMREKQTLSRRNPKGFTISRSPKMNLGANIQRRAKGKEKQGPTRAAFDSKEDQKLGRLAKKAVSCDVGGSVNEGPISPGMDTDNPPHAVDRLDHPVEIQSGRRRLLLEEDMEEEMSPLFASLRDAGYSVELKTIAGGRGSYAPNEPNVESEPHI